MLRTIVIALAATAVIAAPARANCWRPDHVAAAKVRDLETMLMVSALRCRGRDATFISRYNHFVVQTRPALVQVNAKLRAHFADSVGQRRAMDAYDGYVTRIANRYGAGAAGLSCQDLSDITDAAISEKPSFQGLAALAERAGVEPLIEGSTCPVEYAQR